MRNGVAINNHIHPVGATSTITTPVAQIPVAAPVEAPDPALVMGKPLSAVFVPHVNIFIDNEEWLTAMLTSLTQHNENHGDHVKFLLRD